MYLIESLYSEANTHNLWLKAILHMKFEFSAGGIVYKKDGEMISILVCQHSGHHGWVFPKGHIDTGETKEQTALREVMEETGVTGTIIQPLEPIQYWFVQKEQKIKKTVYYFLMQYEAGDIDNHDDEMQAVEWLPIDAVADRLSYPSDKKIWKKTRDLILDQ
jgi:8-oxo-dGTP diphosphatase